MLRRTLMAALAALPLAGPVAAQPAWPTQPIVMIIPFAPGPIDGVARIIGDAMGRDLGQPVVIENVPGAGGTIGVGRAAQARPDGYRILMHNIGMSTAPTLYRRLAWDPVRDFEPIGIMNRNPMVWIGRPSFPGTTLQEMTAYLQRQGTAANLAHAGLGSSSQLCAMLMQAALRSQATTVPFRSSGEVFPELNSGRIDLYCDQTTSALGQVQGGTVKAFALAAPQRLPMMPAVPTTAEAGMPDFQLSIWQALFAPAGTPRAVVDRLNRALRVALADPRVVTRLNELGTAPEPEATGSPEALRALLVSEVARWKPIIEAAGEFAD
ncbi:tripartite tricarboxylate transporter substrate binding protein BugD [Roseomonas stagni]|uniref:Tripartite tricarboxylate transporter substrate binding protein BugD n=1 Tax=Falsiroseomonas algicola TaxID=2716930 RepID=A0A6M1LSF7_9PROT|nr:tripartite tricarboxylate transporter substrate-binding protein [Falsiroseomonas algicola]NGM23388.1 tripartite tricarboxylate transporter substrate binding protein BugD [Falsiroseomonas algicola]